MAALFGLPSAVLLPTSGLAQSAPDEIIVSVRRKDENLQDVPIAVSALSEETIQRYGINDVGDVAKFTPGIQFDEGFGAQDTRVVIRGLSPTRGRANVALLVDGIDYTGEAVSTAGGGVLVNQQLLDIERIEVVKGPQSALYGRSAFAGALQYITKRPSLEEASGDLQFQMGTDGTTGGRQQRISGAYGGPVTENFGLRVNGLLYDDAGFYRNELSGQRVGGRKGFGAAISGLWDAGGPVTINGRLAGSSEEFEPQAQARIRGNQQIDINDSLIVQTGGTTSLVRSSGLVGLIGGTTTYPQCAGLGLSSDGTVTSCFGTPNLLVVGQMPDADQLSIQQSVDFRNNQNYPGTEVNTITGNLNFSFEVEGGTFTSYTGIAAVDSNQFFDGQNDALPAGSYSSFDGVYNFTLPPCGFADCSPTAQQIGFNNETRLLSQEFRFASDLEGPLNYTAGALFWSEKVKQREFGSTVSPAIFRRAPSFGPPNPNAPLPVNTEPPALSVFGQINTVDEAVVRRDTDSFSIYGQLTWDISDKLTATFEGRLVQEELTVAGPVCDTARTPELTGLPNVTTTFADGSTVVTCDAQFRGASSVGITGTGGTLPAGIYTKPFYNELAARFDDSFFAPKATIQYTPNDDQLFYFSVAQGIKPGGISTITAGAFFDPGSNTFQPEKLLAYEFGWKNSMLDGTLVVNTALFYQDYTDKQVGVSRFDPTIGTDVGSIENAGEAEILGLEIDAFWQITDRFSLSGAYTYVDSEYSKFEILTSSANNIARSLASGGQGCLAFAPGTDLTNGIAETCVVDLSGNKFEDVPEHAFVGNARYVAPFGSDGKEWYADVSFIYQDERFMDEFNVKSLDAYWLTDLRLGLIDDRFEVVLFVDNAFDDDTVKTGVDFGSQVATTLEGKFPPGPLDGVIVTLPDPRTIGVRASFNF
jgi:outer membrane receptor protein involved in Fe transport